MTVKREQRRRSPREEVEERELLMKRLQDGRERIRSFLLSLLAANIGDESAPFAKSCRVNLEHE